VRVGVDVGGTFTDLVAVGPRGFVVVKVPSTTEAPELGIWHAWDEAGLDAPETLIHGTTIATNALLERKGARVVLVTTAGFEDLLELRRQDRASLYDLARMHPPPLVPRERVVGVRERMGPEGTITPLAPDAVQEAVAAVRALRPQAVALSLLFGFRHPAHERILAGALRAALDVPVVVAHELVPRAREYERTATVTAEAFLRPRVGRYVVQYATDAVARGVPEPRMLASSGGALVPELAAERAVWLALSGPAGGIQGAALVGAASGFDDLLTLDMGGTSADAGVVQHGEAMSATEGIVAGVPLLVPHIAIESVSAGGGSVGWLDSGGALRVGPESAGASPGPACYGRGGTEPTVTDAYVVLGWIPDGAVLGGSVAVDQALARRAVAMLAERAGLTAEACALGMIRVAEAAMARALRRVSVERGLDPAGLTLVAFGGAGPLSGCAVAELTGVRRVVLPPLAGVLSALGMAAATETSERSMAVHQSASAFAASAAQLAESLAAQLAQDLPESEVAFVAECRYAGQGYELDVPCGPGGWGRVEHDFHEVHGASYGYRDPAGEVEVIELRAIARRNPPLHRIGWQQSDTASGASRLRLHFADGEMDASGWQWEGLRTGQVLAGPAVVGSMGATALIPPGWTGRVNEIGAIVAEAGDARAR